MICYSYNYIVRVTQQYNLTCLGNPPVVLQYYAMIYVRSGICSHARISWKPPYREALLFYVHT